MSTNDRSTARGSATDPPPPGDSPLRHRDFVVFLVVVVATALAIEMSFVAIGWQVYAVRGNPLDLGLVGLAMFLPLPLLALPAGHLADRSPRRTVLALSIATDIAVALGLLAVTQAGADVIWPFFISASNELGAFESGLAAALVGAVPAVVLGGLATIVVAAVWWRTFPALRTVDRLEDLRPVAATAPG